MSRSEELFARAQAVTPGGVNSPVRAFRGVGGTPRFIARAHGAHLIDVDGNSYVDYVMSWGPLILGHAHPAIVRAARDALDRGSTYGAPTPGEVELAETVCAAVPGVGRVRLVSSGTEATMSALRLARGVTGRDKIVKFAGHYHGHADCLLVAAGSGAATFGTPDSAGVTRAAAADTLVVGWNDRAAVEAAFAAHGEWIAALICEPVAANMGVVPPEPGFLALLRDITRRFGALLVFDEVLTGFRVARGGVAETSGITPDLVTLGKVLGGGFPLAAFGGTASVMAHLAPEGPVYQAGTLSGNPVAVAAGLAQLEHLDATAYARLEATADRLVEGLDEAFAKAGVPAQLPRARSLFGVFFSGEPVRDFVEARAADHQRYARFFHGMLARGHYLPPSGYEALFVSLAHTPDDIGATLTAARETAAALGT
ncbi:MAG: glutamate-1-semialdehyde 2,1-aminomutase [Egibacteraceae bacterium]